jgi:hypothetical protein
MLIFVVPLKSPEVSKSWQLTCQLFERCVRSICNQNSPEFRVVVVCHEKPEIEFNHPYIHYVKVDFPLPKHKNIIARGLTDKGRKVLMGLTYAYQFNPTHAMLVDADDCVSKNLAALVNNSVESNGWFVNSGYKYQEGSKYIYLKRKNFYRMSGTANIIRFDLLDLPELPEYNRGYGYYKFYLDHQKVRDYMRQKGTPIKPVIFPGSVYILGTENMSGNVKNLSFNFINRRLLTPKIKEEFGLYNIQPTESLIS